VGLDEENGHPVGDLGDGTEVHLDHPIWKTSESKGKGEEVVGRAGGDVR